MLISHPNTNFQATGLAIIGHASLKGETNLDALERLAAMSPSLESLKVKRPVPLDALTRLILPNQVRELVMVRDRREEMERSL